MRVRNIDYDALIGQRSHRLLVEAVIRGGRDTKLSCVCDCGGIALITFTNFKTGNTGSCGCWKKEFGVIRGKSNITHGMSETKEFRTWQSMKRRCYAKHHKDYKWYGARGITVCDRWRESFVNFFADMGLVPDGMSIDRKDNNLGYSPDNCKWSTPTEQNNNRRPSCEWDRAL